MTALAEKNPIFLFNFDNIEVSMAFKSNIELLSTRYLTGG